MNKTESILKEHEINITDIKGHQNRSDGKCIGPGPACTVILAGEGYGCRA